MSEAQPTNAPAPASAASGPKLRDRLRQGRRRQQALAAALLVVAAAGALLVDRPARRAIARDDAARAELDGERDANLRRAAALPELRDAVADLRRRVERHKPLRGPADIQQGFADITTFKSETPLSAYKFETVGAPRSLGSCLEQKVRITFDADFADAMSLIRKVEAMNRLTRVRSLRVAAARSDAGARGGQVSVELALSLFFRTSDDPSDAAPSDASPRTAAAVAGVGQP